MAKSKKSKAAVKKEESTQKVTLSTRVDKELRDSLDELANQERRSTSNYVENVLIDHVAFKKKIHD